jgi:translation initiation factor 3 subunit H
MADRKVKSEAAGAGVAAPPAAKKDGVIDLVQIDGLAVLKIIKHCHEETSGVMDVAQGVLLGLVSDNKLEITNSFPFPRAPDENMDEEDYQLEMMRNLRKINIDHFHVGWYQSTQQGNFISPPVLESQYTYQIAISESVVLIYDPAKTARGFLSLRAFKLSPQAVQLYKDEDFSPEKVKSLGLSFEELLVEIKVVIKNSHLVNALLLELQEAIPVADKPYDYLDLGTTGVLEKQLRYMMESVDELAQEVNKYNIFQRQVVKQNQMKQQALQRRALENESRATRGEPPLPDDDIIKQFKPIPSPSRKEGVITSGQVLSYSDQISRFASQALGKWFLTECLQEARSKQAN